MVSTMAVITANQQSMQQKQNLMFSHYFNPICLRVLFICLMISSMLVNCINVYQAFPNFIQTGKVVFPGSLSTSTSATFSLTFSTNKTNTNYGHALTYQSVNLKYSSGRYSCLFKVTTPTISAMDIGVYTNLTYTVQYLSIRYLIVESSYPYLLLVHFQWNTNLFRFAQNTYYTRYMSINPVTSTCSAYCFISGMDFISNANNQIQINPLAYLQNSTSLTLQFYNPNSDSVLLNSVWLDVVIYDKITMLTDLTANFRAFFNSMAQTSAAASYYNYGNTVKDSRVFYGINMYYAYNNHIDLYFAFSISGLSLFVHVPTPQSIFIYGIFFEIYAPSPCTNTSFWNSSSNSCATCPNGTFFNLTNISCQACTINNCQICSNATTCTNCTSAYYWNNTDCSSCIPNCQTCATNSTCTICLTTYFWYATNSSCVTTCPAGTYASNYSCTACSLSNCAACSNATTCTNCTNDYYFLNESSCSLCSSIANCQTCSNATTCTNCTAAYFWNGNACLQCMSNCLNCSNSVACSACALTFTLSANASCVCPTAMYNNTASTCTNCNGSLSNCAVCSNSTFCSSCVSPFVLSNTSICVCPVGQYNLTAFSCANCTISNCQACSGQTVCTVCIAPYFNSSGSCALDCSSLSYCSACTYDYSVPTHICTVCNDSNFSVSGVNKRCQPICGNGFVVFGNESCDDGNTDSYDGCSDTCTIEPYYNCTNISNQPSNCTLSSIAMTPLFNVKNSKSNEFTMSYSLEPSSLPIYSRVAWTQAFTVNGFDGTVSAVTYDSAQNRLLVTVQYIQNLDGSDLKLSVNSALLHNSFSTIVPSTVSCLSSTQNNLKLDFYESKAYALAAVVQALSIVTAIVSLLLFVAGYFGAKLIALECVATVQLSSLLLFTLQKVNPTFHALHFLGISLGRTYSQSAYSYQPQSMTPQFKGQTVSYFSAVDYGLSILTVFIPLIVGAVLYALLQTSLRKRMPSTDMWNFAVGEYTFYGLAFCSYSAFATLAIDIRFCDNSAVCFVGIATSAVLGLVILGYCAYFTEHPHFLGEFKKRFETMNICQHFYSFAMIERMINAFLIVCLTSVSFQAVGPLIVLSIELSYILYRKPYVLRGWIRPSVVKSLMIAIVLLFLAAKVAPNSFAIYIPLLMLGCLLICQIYSCVELVLQLKQKWQFSKEGEGKNYKNYSFEESQEIQLREFELKMIPDFDLSQTVMKPVQKPLTSVGWKWKYYDKPYSISANMLREIIQRSVNTKAKIFQDQVSVVQQSDEI